MHSCCIVITKEFPDDDVLREVLSPFNEGDYYDRDEEERERPAFLWDYWQVGGRYNGKIKLRYDLSDEEYGFRYYAKEPRTNSQFRSYVVETATHNSREFRYFGNTIFADDMLFSMGARDGFIYVDGAKAKDITNMDDLSCFCFVDRDGNAASRDDDEYGFDEKLKAALKNSDGCYVCVVDLHD